MFSSLFSFFLKGKEEDESPQDREHRAPGSHIPYYPDLIKHLTAEHKDLLALYQRIENARAGADYGRVDDLLEEFASVLRGHLLTENVKLYVYLKYVLSKDPENAALMQQMRTEMMHIGRSVVAFLDTYHKCAWDEAMRQQFAADMAQIGAVLVKRINTEEDTLYPLYMPPDAYA
ncbi:MAG: hemerythrin domain-containing protein [Gammaproteobacteria bacterium]|nr:hemerythrin domain-containing protein [Gammaproteobacteria bacterium]MBU1654745.1 hemerythrin domain-containing protein [Gammaproteobacteria bacterium]MBU1961620.1 hemerythrin domain-containing protein [Gammaproteobacteria bacterium]